MKRLLAILAPAWVCVLPAVGLSQGIDQLTRPSAIYQLSFVRPGLIGEVRVKEGEPVKKDQVLVRQDDRAEQAQLANLKLQAESMVRVDYAQEKLKYSQLNLARAEKAYKAGGITDMELDEARQDVLLQKASFEVAKLDHKEVEANYEQMKVRVDQMEIRSPADAVVEQIVLKQGEGADALGKVIILLKNDPLWVDVPVNLSQAGKLKLGQTARVQFFGPGENGAMAPSGPPVEGKIVFTASLAQAKQLTVRVEAPNPAGRPAGEPVQVSFDALTGVKAGAGVKAPSPATAPAGNGKQGLLSRASTPQGLPATGDSADGPPRDDHGPRRGEDGAPVPPWADGRWVALLE